MASSILNELGFPCGTLPETKLSVPVRGPDRFPTWSEDRCAEYWESEGGKWDREEWFPVREWYKDQGGIGSCNYYALAGLMERLIRKFFPSLSRVVLSPEFGYAHRVNGRDVGTTLNQSFADFSELGLCLYKDRLYEKYHRSYLRREDYVEAERFRGLEKMQLTSWEHILVCLAFGFPVVVAVHAGRNFMDLDQNGFCGVDRGPGNHAILLDQLYVAPNGEIGAKGPGSWNKNIHDNGIHGIKKSHLIETMKYHPVWVGLNIRLDSETEIILSA